MRRRFVSFISTLSPVLCIALAGLWVRSYWVADWLTASAATSGASDQARVIEIGWEGGGVLVCIQKVRFVNSADTAGFLLEHAKLYSFPSAGYPKLNSSAKSGILNRAGFACLWETFK